MVRAIGKCLAYLVYRSDVRAVRTTRQNIKYCYGHLQSTEQDALVRCSLRHTVCSMLEMPIVWTGSYRRLGRWIREVHGEAAFLAGLKRGAVLLVLPHFGNWEFLTTYMKPITKFSCLYSPRRLYELEELIKGFRSRFGSEFLPLTRPGLRTLIERIQSGGVIVVLPDQVPVDGQWVWSQFLGRSLKTGTLPHALLKRHDMTVFCMVALRCKSGFDIHIREVAGEIHSPDAVQSIQALDLAIEHMIKLDPAQYQWEYKRFRGSAEIYS